MSKTKTAIVELYEGDSGSGWRQTGSHLVPIHLTRKDDYDKKWYYFNIPHYRTLRNGERIVGYYKCKFQEQRTPDEFNQPYVFTKQSSTGKWVGNVKVGEYPDTWAWVKLLSLDFAEVSHA